MFDRPRNWKWMVPAALAGPCIWWWNDWFISGGNWKELAIIPLVITSVLTIAALMNVILYIYAHWTDLYEAVQSARNSTAEVRMFEAAKGMHPDAVKALLLHRRSIWRIKYVPLKDVVDWIFDEAPTVHAGFVDFVLDHSGASIMSKRLLSEGSKQFDPEEIVTDYQQYDDLIILMQQKLMCTQAYGNQPPQWLAPWNPDLVRHQFGLDGAPYAVTEENVSEAMKSVMRAQAQWKSNGLKDFGSTQQTAVKRPVVIEQKTSSPDDDFPQLSDEELEVIRKG